jgi:CHAT domain-containing protein
MPSRQHRSYLRLFLGSLFLISLIVCLCFGQVQQPAASSQPPGANASQLVQQGVERYRVGDYQGAIALWQSALTSYQTVKNPTNEAIVLENLARAYRQLGQNEQAIAQWDQAVTVYRKLGNAKQVGRMLTEQAQTYSSLGQPRKAIALLCGAFPKDKGTQKQEFQLECLPQSALQIAQNINDQMGKVAAVGSLGDAYRLYGNYNEAIWLLQENQSLVQTINNPAYTLSTLNTLGNAYVSLAQVNYRREDAAIQAGDNQGVNSKAAQFQRTALEADSKALKSFEQSLNLARSQNDPQAQMRGLLNAIPVYYRTKAFPAAAAALETSLSLLDQLPDSQAKVFAAIELTHLLQPLSNRDTQTFTENTSSKNRCLKPELSSRAANLLQKATAIAQHIGDQRSKSFALGELGHVYECRQDYSQALTFTQAARVAADQDLRAKDSLYLWEWQTGRLLKAKGDIPAAIAAYARAIATLEAIRSDILTANRDVQFDFRDTVDPIYREYVALQLNQAQPAQANKQTSPPVDTSKKLGSILQTIDSLKLAELQNYFGNDCVLTAINQETADQVADASTAVFSTIILEDQTAVIVSLPNGQKQFKWIAINHQSLINQINEFRQSLESFRNREDYDPTTAKQIYDWLIGPFAADLEQAKIKTLVFVQDGILRSVPMAALYDGQQFLIQKYAIATTPSLTLTDPKALNRNNLRVLALGLSTPSTIDNQKFPALGNVEAEIEDIEKIPGTKKLLNDEFTLDRLQEELRKTVYPIIHIATHGEFGADPEETFIVTGKNQKLTLNDLEKVIRNFTRNTEPLELLTLTACQTAAGDDRSALGLAGVAVQAGARSALASLWSIDDAATAKIATDFYTSLQDPRLSKAEALQIAQKALIEGATIKDQQYTHPAYWAPFVLIGNWL